MGWTSWFSWGSQPAQTPEQTAQAKFCSGQFPELWVQWVQHFTDAAFHGGACATPAEAGVQQAPPPTRVPAAERLVAIGDLHGDLGKARRAFRLAGLTDHHDRWAGGKSVCVQVGDILDRGDAELQILYFLERLQAEAEQAGGKLYVLNGNHETMNVMGNHRYATAGASREIGRWQRWQQLAERLRSHCSCSADGSSTSGNSSSSSSKAGSGGGSSSSYPAAPPPALAALHTAGAFGTPHFMRTFALQPGSTIASRFFANHPTVLQVGQTVFVHGGVLPEHVNYGLERINAETSHWMRGGRPAPPSLKPADPPSPGSAAAAPPAPSGSHATATSTTGLAAAPATAPNPSPAQLQQQARQQQQQQHLSTSTPPPAPQFLRGASAIVWARDYSAEDTARCDCEKLERVLQAIPGASRMVMGHTIQDEGINSACGGRALRVDVGMSRGCGDGEVEVLEIVKDGQQVRRLREGLPPEDLTHQRGTGKAGHGMREAPEASSGPWALGNYLIEAAKKAIASEA